MSTALLMLAAWAIEAVLGWPDWLYRHIRHPVVWFGTLVRSLEAGFNQERWPHGLRYTAGAFASLLAICIAVALAWLVSQSLPDGWAGFSIEALVASSLIASRSLYQHVSSVAVPLATGDMDAARTAVSRIVGRDPEQLEAAGIARASVESLAENASDGVVAPLFWGAIFGLPGLAGYKAINTLDSMIGHRTERYAAFGGFAARLDDVANLVPARLTGLLFAMASVRPAGFQIMLSDAPRHRSPNAGWPEAAMAGALGIRLSGPRNYGDRQSHEPWLNPAASDPDAHDIRRALRLYVKAMILSALLLCGMALLWIQA